MVVTLDGRSLSLESAIDVAERGVGVRVSVSSLRRMEKFRSLLDQKLGRGEVVYGVNTGFGSLSDKAVRLGNLKELQLNLIRSHAAGVGNPMPQEVVRAAMVIRLNSLLNGNSAVRTEVAELIAAMLNKGVTPRVPEFGSLGACLAGNSLVYTNPSGPKEICQLKPGDKVYSFVGSLKKDRVVDRNGVANNLRYGFDGDLRTNRVLRVIDSGVQQTFRLETYTRDLVCTDNHPFLKLSILRSAKGERADYRLEWKELRELNPGDLILVVKKLRDEGKPLHIILPYLNETTPDFMRLLGMIIGDGYITHNLKSIMIALPPGPERQKYSDLIEGITGKRPSEYHDCIVIFSKPLATLLSDLGLAKKALEKRVPHWAYSLPIEQRIAFLEGYEDADATFHDRLVTHKDGHRWHQSMITFASPNADLIKDLRVLAISCGMRCGKVRSRMKTRGLWFNGKGFYDYSNPSTSHEFHVMRRGFFPYSFSGKVNIDITNPHFYFDKIVSIVSYKEQHVFDIEVEGTHNFVSEGVVVHNSGDLVPSAHMALTMVGEGRAYHRHRLTDSRKALAASKLKPIVLHAKEGLSLINGTAFTTALGAVVTHRGSLLLEAANCSVALTGEVLGACSQSFDERLIGMKKDSGQEYVAKRIRQSLKDSLRIRAEPVPQDPYSIRCAPQVHGSLKDALGFAEKLVVDEMNSVSDNPVLLEDGTVLHGGNFHAQPVAMALDLMSIALAYIGVISLGRINLLLSKTPPETKYMAGKPGLESGLMILQYTATALTADNATQVYPQSAYPASVSGGIEDHASHGVNAGMKAVAVASNVSKVLAIELICASNLLGSNDTGISEHSKQVCAVVRSLSPLLRGDRSQADEIETLASAIAVGKLP